MSLLGLKVTRLRLEVPRTRVGGSEVGANQLVSFSCLLGCLWTWTSALIEGVPSVWPERVRRGEGLFGLVWRRGFLGGGRVAGLRAGGVGRESLEEEVCESPEEASDIIWGMTCLGELVGRESGEGGEPLEVVCESPEESSDITWGVTGLSELLGVESVREEVVSESLEESSDITWGVTGLGELLGVGVGSEGVESMEGRLQLEAEDPVLTSGIPCWGTGFWGDLGRGEGVPGKTWLGCWKEREGV